MGIGRGTRSGLLELVDGAPSGRPTQAQQPEALTGRESFETFYRRQLPQLLVLARALVGSLLAEDVAQEAMLVVYRRWAEVQVLESPGGLGTFGVPAQRRVVGPASRRRATRAAAFGVNDELIGSLRFNRAE